ncbi:MAG: hypothetical protein KAI66_12100 [Lentisphaeria bacterium]|nr:hypothetical protein [Lentisphaeria bacterium]
MDCTSIQHKWLEAGAASDAKIAEHLRVCPECRAFADVAQRVLEVEEGVDAGPSPELDSRVLAMVLDRSAAGRRSRAGIQRFSRRLVALAAALVVLAFLVLHSLRPSADGAGQLAQAGGTALDWEEAFAELDMLDGEIEQALAEVSELVAATSSDVRAPLPLPSDGFEALEEELFQIEIDLLLEDDLFGEDFQTEDI